MMVIMIGNFIIVGVMNEVNRFLFILIFKGFLFLWLLVILVKVLVGMFVMRFLVEIR